ncbi:MAG TPA: tetratricopeptide repeat protein [Thermoanaerobaculia bacterium]
MPRASHLAAWTTGTAALLMALGLSAPLRAEDDAKGLETRLAAAKGRDQLALLVELATAGLERRDYPAALDYGGRAEALARELDDAPKLALALRITGDAHRLRDEYAPSLVRYREAIDLLGEDGDRGELAKTLYHAAISYWHLGDPAHALELSQRSYQLAVELEDRRAQASALNMAGLVNTALERYPQSLDYYLRVLDLVQELRDEQSVGRVLNNVGNAYRNMGQPAEALVYYQRALETKQQADDERYPSTLSNIGLAYRQMGELERALTYSQRALASWEAAGDRKEIAVNLSRIGGLYDELGDHGAAEAALERCLDLAAEIGSRDTLAGCQEALAKVYEATGRFREALAAYRAYEQIRRETFNEESGRSLAELEARFGIDQKEHEIELLRRQQEIDSLELGRKVQTGRALAGGMVMMGLLLSLLYGRHRAQVKASRTIADKNRELETALAELSESETRYRRLFKDPTIGKLVIDPLREVVLDANEPARLLLGRSGEDLTDVAIAEVGCEWLDRMLSRPASESTDSRVIVEAFEHVADGETRYYEAWVSPLSLGGRPAALLTLNDVTERRNLEEQRVRQQERERYIAELETRKAEVEARNAEMERFTYTVSHDLKSPLFTIRGFLGYLRKDVSEGNPARIEKNIEHINGAVAKMGKQLDELLELSRIGRVASPPQDVAVAELALEVTETLAALITERGARVDVAADMPPAFGDRQRLGEVLQNLIENAVKFMGSQPDPRVEVAWRRDGGGKTVYFVRDNGVGIAGRYHDRVFGLFDRLDPAVDGSGVGLALVKRIIEVHGGRIWIESEGDGRGSTFCFTLPSRKTARSAARRRR